MEMTPTDVYLILFGLPMRNRRLDSQAVAEIYRGYQPAVQWLSHFDDPSPPRRRTFLAYEKEVLRFYIWLTTTVRKPLWHVNASDLNSYAAFLSNPLPAKYWIGTRRNRPTAKSGTRQYLPFGGPLGSASRRYAINTVRLMLRESELAIDIRGPATAISSRTVNPSTATYRSHAVSEEFCRRVSAVASALPSESTLERRARARLQFLIELFQSTGIQTSEALAARMGDIFAPSGGPNRSQEWVLRIAAGMPRERLVPLSASFLSKFTEYLSAFGLPSPPYLSKQLPLVLRTQSNCLKRGLTRQQLHHILRPILLEAQASLSQSNEPAAALTGSQAPALWSRYCAASCLLHPLEVSVNDLARRRLPHLSEMTLAKIALRKA